MNDREAAVVLRALAAEFEGCVYSFFEDRVRRGPLARRVAGPAGGLYETSMHVAPADGGAGLLRVTFLVEDGGALGGRPLRAAVLVAPDGSTRPDGGPDDAPAG